MGIFAEDDARELRTAAASAVYARIERDRRIAPGRLQPLLAHIRTALFEPSLSVDSLRRACDERDNGISTVFGRYIGETPRRYIEARRMETARWLLRHSDLPVAAVAGLVGFGDQSTFGGAFKRCTGVAPTAYRKRSAPADRRRSGARPDRLRLIVDGRGTARETESLLVRMQNLTARRRLVAPAGAALGEKDSKSISEPPAPPIPATRLVIAGSALERARAEAIWSVLRARPAAQRPALVRGLAAASPVLFELLIEKSRSEGRGDRRRGVAVAELALDSLPPRDLALEDGAVAGLWLRGYAWLGNAHRLALDFPAAERAFARTAPFLEIAGVPPLARAERYDLEAALRLYQGRYRQALALSDLALPLFDQAGAAMPRVRSLVQRALIRIWSGAPAEALPDLASAEALLVEIADRQQHFYVHYNLAVALIDCGEHDRSEEALVAAKRSARWAGLDWALPLLAWSEGLVAIARDQPKRAERALESARRAFSAVDDHYQVAAVDIELALLAARRGRSIHAARYAAEAVPLLAALDLAPHTVAMLGLVHAGLEREAAVDTLERVRAAVCQATPGPIAGPPRPRSDAAQRGRQPGNAAGAAGGAESQP